MSIPPTQKDPFLLSEDQVVAMTAKWLKTEGFRIESARKGHAPGVDIIAFNDKTGERYFVEAKGNIKNDNTSGKQFKSLQIATHFCVQLWQICEVMHRYREEPKPRFAIANPHVPRILNRIEVSKTALKRLPIELIWVTPKKVWSETISGE